MKYIPVSVYKDSSGTDCTAGGVSSKNNTIYIQCESGFLDGKGLPDELKFKVEKRSVNYWAAIPETKKEGLNGPMFGGNLAYTSDSRCPAPLHVHDRYEVFYR